MNDKIISRNIKTEFNELTTDQIRDYSFKNSYPFVILAFNIQSNLNMGSMLRTAHLCGCRKFIIFGRRKYDKRSAVGVYNYIDVERIQGLKNPQQDLTSELNNLDYIFDSDIFVNFIIENNYIPIFIKEKHQFSYLEMKALVYLVIYLKLDQNLMFRLY